MVAPFGQTARPDGALLSRVREREGVASNAAATFVAFSLSRARERSGCVRVIARCLFYSLSRARESERGARIPTPPLILAHRRPKLPPGSAPGMVHPARDHPPGDAAGVVEVVAAGFSGDSGADGLFQGGVARLAAQDRAQVR